MSTYLGELRTRDPERAADLAMLGNQPTVCLRNMVKALRMCPWLNTPADEDRLAAAQRELRRRQKEARS
jgi:hypothetical protein